MTQLAPNKVVAISRKLAPVLSLALIAQAAWIAFMLIKADVDANSLFIIEKYAGLAICALCFYSALIFLFDKGKTVLLLSSVLIMDLLLFAGLGLPYIIGGISNFLGVQCIFLSKTPISCIEYWKLLFLMFLWLFPLGLGAMIIVVFPMVKGSIIATRSIFGKSDAAL